MWKLGSLPCEYSPTRPVRPETGPETETSKCHTVLHRAGPPSVEGAAAAHELNEALRIVLYAEGKEP
jgi:hypothetical protein